MKAASSLLTCVVLLGLGCAANSSHRGPSGDPLARTRIAAYIPVVPPRLAPSSPEAAAANKARGDAALAKGDLVLRGSTAGLVVVELEGSEMLERSSVDLPGATSDLALVGGLVYAAQGPAGLAVIDISDSTNPSIASYLDTPGGCVRLHASGNEVVVAEGSLGLAVLDAKDPRAPRAVATWQGRDYVRHAIAQGKYVYAADGRAGIAVLERRGTQLHEVARLEPGGDARALFARGDKLLAALGGKGLAIFDLQVPERPNLLSLTKVPDAARDVVADEKTAFVAGGDEGLLVVDISDSAAPTLSARLPTPTPANRVRLDGDHVFLGADSSGLLVVDVSDRAHPRQTHPVPEAD